MQSLLGNIYEKYKETDKKPFEVGDYVTVLFPTKWDVGIIEKLERGMYTVRMAPFLEGIITIPEEDKIVEMPRTHLVECDDIEEIIDDHHRVMRNAVGLSDLKDV